MNICPKCGFAIEVNSPLDSNPDVSCSRCSWYGGLKDTIWVSEHLIDKENAVKQLEGLYVDLANEVSPIIGKILFRRGLVNKPTGDPEKDKNLIQFVAKIAQGATRGAIQGITSVIVKEISGGTLQ